MKAAPAHDNALQKLLPDANARRQMYDYDDQLSLILGRRPNNYYICYLVTPRKLYLLPEGELRGLGEGCVRPGGGLPSSSEGHPRHLCGGDAAQMIMQANVL